MTDDKRHVFRMEWHPVAGPRDGTHPAPPASPRGDDLQVARYFINDVEVTGVEYRKRFDEETGRQS